jgi:transposase
MYRDVAQWSNIRHRILVEGISRRQIVRETKISWQTVGKMLAYPHPQPHAPRTRNYRKLEPHRASILRLLHANAASPPSERLSVQAIYSYIHDNEGFRGGYSTVSDYARSMSSDDDCIWEHTYDLLVSLEKKRAIDLLFLLSRGERSVISPTSTKDFFREAAREVNVAPKPDWQAEAQRTTFEWMRAVLQKEVDADVLRPEIGELPEFSTLLHHLYEGRLSDRNRSMVILATRRGLSQSMICAFLDISPKSCGKYLRAFERGGSAALFARQTKSTRKFDNEAITKAVFGILHEPPSNHGINRTSWTMAHLCAVLAKSGNPACPEVVRAITKEAGYKWRKARVVLTSNDPDYSAKLDRIRSILSGLQPDEAFFSIDEFGPFAVKAKTGRTLTAPGELREVPQWQKSKGCLILTAALELSSNQVTHFYSLKKNTTEMIRMMELLLERYQDKKRLYLSWDAASWHISKRLFERIEQNNQMVAVTGGTLVETAPLPARAQFLNVIEAIFSGMARAIIHSSDYKSVDDAKTAINTYFDDRNRHFLAHPRRAGNKIWGKERMPASFSAANNCKDPRYR